MADFEGPHLTEDVQKPPSHESEVPQGLVDELNTETEKNKAKTDKIILSLEGVLGENLEIRQSRIESLLALGVLNLKAKEKLKGTGEKISGSTRIELAELTLGAGIEAKKESGSFEVKTDTAEVKKVKANLGVHKLDIGYESEIESGQFQDNHVASVSIELLDNNTLRLTLAGEVEFENGEISPKAQINADLKNIPVSAEIALSKADGNLLAEGKINIDLNRAEEKWKIFAEGKAKADRASGIIGVERRF